MKRLQFLLPAMLLAFVSMNTSAQTAGTSGGGIYLTAQDFADQHLSYALDYNRKSDKLQMKDFFGSPNVSIVRNGEKKSFKKDSIYGVITRDNKVYRFAGRTPYQVVDTSDFVIYYRYETDYVSKGGSLKEGKYYFSKTENSEIIPLTKANLDRAFLQNTKFRYDVDSHFSRDSDLSAYDSFSKMYMIKYLYAQAKKG